MSSSFLYEAAGVSEVSISSYLLLNRNIFLKDCIDSNSANEFIERLLFLELQGQEPITIYIHSPGGELDAMFAMYDTMMLCKSNIITIGVGSVCSAAVPILASGTKGLRKITANTRILLHQIYEEIEGKHKDIQSFAAESKKLDIMYTEILSKHTGHSVRKLNKDMTTDFWLGALDALNYGLIDDIL